MTIHAIATFASLSRLRIQLSLRKLASGSLIKTRGYSTIDDGKAAIYKITDTLPVDRTFPPGQTLELEDGRWISLESVVINQETYITANVRDYGAVGDGVVDDTPAFLAAMSFASLNDGLVLYVPPGLYKLTENLVFDTPIVLRGAGSLASYLNFASNKGIRLMGGAAFSVIENLRYYGSPQNYPEWQPNHAYVVGDRVRNILAPLGSTPPSSSFPSNEIDFGIHLKCTQSGVTGPTQPTADWFLRDEHAFVDGTVHWETEDGSGISIHTVFVTIRNCLINFAVDNGILVYGDGFEFIADGTIIEACGITDVGGSCVFTNGSDGQLTKVIGCSLGAFPRGAGIFDTGFFNSLHSNNQAVVGRWPYVGTGQVAATVWLSNYHEACDTGIWISPIQQWIGGWPNIDSGLADSRSLGNIQGGDFFKGVFRILDSHTPPFRRDIGGSGFEEWSRTTVNGTGLTDAWITTDSDDLGGYLSQRWLGQARETSREITAPSSAYGPGKWRFPQGFFLGKNMSGDRTQMWITSLDHPPSHTDLAQTRQNLYHTGDTVLNELTGLSDPGGWRAQRNGGWGGGRQYNGGRVWEAGEGNIAIGEGIEPSVPNGKVFKLLRFEVFTGGVWVSEDRYFASLSNTEPTWPTVDGQTVTELLDVTHRIVWQCHGDVGMDWAVLPTPTGSVST